MRYPYENVFTDCLSLEELYLPNAIYLPQIFPSDEEKGSDKMKLRYVYAPKACELSSQVEAATFLACGNLEWIYLPSLEYVTSSMFHRHPMTIYLSDKLQKYDDPMYFNKDTTIVAPKNSPAYEMAKKYDLKFIPSDSMVNAMGGSIRTTDAGLRFGFSWDEISEIEDLADNVEYGFVYTYNAIDENAETASTDLRTGAENALVRKADKRNVDGSVSYYNAVFTEIPKSHFDDAISARAYVCIDGMYFYSPVKTRSFTQVANAVLADDEIDGKTKESIRDLLSGEV